MLPVEIRYYVCYYQTNYLTYVLSAKFTRSLEILLRSKRCKDKSPPGAEENVEPEFISLREWLQWQDEWRRVLKEMFEEMLRAMVDLLTLRSVGCKREN